MNYRDYSLIPEDMMKSIRLYVDHGCPLGHFLTAVFSNDLFEAVGRADDVNRVLIPTYVIYIYNKVPRGCHGSREIVEKWIKTKRDNEL